MAFDPTNRFNKTTTVKPGKPSGEQPGSGYTWGGGRTDTNTFASPDVSKQTNRTPHLPGNPWHGIFRPTGPVGGGSMPKFPGKTPDNGPGAKGNKTYSNTGTTPPSGSPSGISTTKTSTNPVGGPGPMGTKTSNTSSSPIKSRIK